MSGRALKAKLAPDSSGIWLGAVERGAALGDVQVPLLSEGATRMKNGQPVWVVGKGVKASTIVDAGAEGLLKLLASHCGGGGVVFDRGWRVLALCVPGAGSKTEPDLAVAALTAGRIRGASETNRCILTEGDRSVQRRSPRR